MKRAKWSTSSSPSGPGESLGSGAVLHSLVTSTDLPVSNTSRICCRVIAASSVMRIQCGVGTTQLTRNR